MRILLVALLCLLATTVFGIPTNNELKNGFPSMRETIDWSQIRILMAQSTVERKIVSLIHEYLEEKQTVASLTDLMVDIRTYVLESANKGSIFNLSIVVDEKKFLEDSRFYFEVRFDVVPTTGKEAVLTFDFKITLEEDETVH
jgi:hypothetical protein